MNNINPSDSGLGLVETGRFWENDGQSGIVRIVEFGGSHVSDLGLVLVPPAGGDLTVWPDGRYAFTGSAGEFADSVSTHYSYVAEAVDGSLVSGSFSLGEHLSVESLPDFQGWSIDDILALDNELGNGAEPDVSAGGGHSAGGLAGADFGLADASNDILDYMLHGSFES